MCGIVYLEDKKEITGKVNDLYKAQKTRGQQGFGFVALKDGSVQQYGRAQHEAEIMKKLEKLTDTEKVLFHHRFPTSAINLPETAHPIKVSGGPFKNVYYFVHNGVISNADERKKDHKKMGIKYRTEVVEKTEWKAGKSTYTHKETSFNDSESLAIDMALFIEGIKDKVESRGSAAYVCIEADKEGRALRLHYGRNYGNPLIAYRTKEGRFQLTSQAEGTNGTTVIADLLHTVDYSTGKITTKPCIVPEFRSVASYRDAGYQGYSKMGFDTTRGRGAEQWPDYQDELEYHQILDNLEAADMDDYLCTYQISDLLAMGYNHQEIAEALIEDRHTFEAEGKKTMLDLTDKRLVELYEHEYTTNDVDMVDIPEGKEIQTTL